MSSPRALSTFPPSSVNVKHKQIHKEIHIKFYPHYMMTQSAFVEDISRENSDCKNVICVFRYFSSQSRHCKYINNCKYIKNTTVQVISPHIVTFSCSIYSAFDLYSSVPWPIIDISRKCY